MTLLVVHNHCTKRDERWRDTAINLNKVTQKVGGVVRQMRPGSDADFVNASETLNSCKAVRK